MDRGDLTRRYEQSGYSSTQAYGTNLRATSGIGGYEQRFSPVHAQPLQSSRTNTSGSGSSRPSSQSFPQYGIYQQSRGQHPPQLEDSPYQYPGFGTPESQGRQAQSQQPQFSSIPSSNMVFSLPSALSQQSSYEPSLPSFQSRASTSMEALTSAHLGLAQQQQPQAYYHTDAPSATAHAYASTTPYQAQPPIYRSTTRDHRASAASETSGYQAEVADYAQQIAISQSEQQQQQQHPRPEDMQGQGGDDGEEEYANYYEALRQTFQHVVDGRLVEAGQRLLELTDWLHNNAQGLGLTLDREEQQERRYKLWHDFNHCWLAVLQRQKDLTLAMVENGQPLPPAQTMLQEDFLERMGRNLVAVCDTMERHGLVDYQMGIWEEEIMNVLLECLALLEPPDEQPSNIPARSRAQQ